MSARWTPAALRERLRLYWVIDGSDLDTEAGRSRVRDALQKMTHTRSHSDIFKNNFYNISQNACFSAPSFFSSRQVSKSFNHASSAHATKTPKIHLKRKHH